MARHGFKAVYDIMLTDSERVWTIDALCRALDRDPDHAQSRNQIAGWANTCIKRGLVEREAKGVYRLATEEPEQPESVPSLFEHIGFGKEDGAVLLST